jgi:hypothetical protein
VFKDFQKRNGTLSSTGLKIMKNGWQNLIGIIFIFRYIFWMFLRETGNCLIRICGKNNLDYQLLKAEVLDIQKNESIYKLIVADDFANK